MTLLLVAFVIYLAGTPACEGQTKVLFQDGALQQCDVETPCPAGYTCIYSHFVAGVKGCYSNVRDTNPRPGRCPLPSELAAPTYGFGQGQGFGGAQWAFGQQQNSRMGPQPFGYQYQQQQQQQQQQQLMQQQGFGNTAGQFGGGSGACGQECYIDSDCYSGQQRCCYSQNCGRTCVNAVQLDPSIRVTVLLDGNNQPISGGQSGSMVAGTVALVQSQGRNVLWDTGTVAQKMELIKALREKAGLELNDIHQVLTSHAHPGHITNWHLFPDTFKNWFRFSVRGSSYMFNQFNQNPAPRYFVLGDQNMELVLTPGHTQQDTSLLVYNVPQMGTVALAGDAIQDQDDWDRFPTNSLDPNLQRETRRRLFCSANFVIPGHGVIFAVTDQHRSRAGGCQGVQNYTQPTGSQQQSRIQQQGSGVIQLQQPIQPQTQQQVNG